MRLATIATGTLALACVLGIAGCGAPTGAPDGQRIPGGSTITFDAMLVVDTAQPGVWLSAGDMFTVRLDVTPDAPDQGPNPFEGTIRYRGVPIWYPAPADSGAFQTSYFTHAELGDRLISVFWGEHLAGARLVLILDPDRLSVQWAVTTTGSEGELIEIARGTGARMASGN